MYQKLISFFNRHYRRYHDFLFYILTLSIIVAATLAAMHITKQKDEQELLNSREKEIRVAQFTVKEKPIYVALQELGLSNREVLQIVEKLNTLTDTRKLQPSDKFSISTTTDDRFAMLMLDKNLSHYYVADVGGQLIAGVSDSEIKTRVRSAAGDIQNSLFQSMLKDGITTALVMDFTDAFSWNIDFFTFFHYIN